MPFNKGLSHLGLFIKNIKYNYVCNIIFISLSMICLCLLTSLHLYFLLNQFLFIFFSSCLKITLSNSILWVNNLFWELVFHGCVLPNALPYRATSWLLFSCPVMSDSLRPHGLQDARPLWPSPSLKVCPKFASVMPFSHLIL